MADLPQKTSDTDGEAHTVAAPLDGVAPTGHLTATEDAPPLVAGRYEILGMLGAGGMGTVYRARDRELDEIVALKLLKKELASAAGMLERFRREVKLARRVTHRNVARTFDIGDHAGDRFLTMELIEGEMLGTHLARRGRVPLRDVIRIGVDVCAGLTAAHAAGVLHRDLKPENVILARDGRAVITDFGIARAVAAGEVGRTMGGIVGTPAYMAPEQVEGATDLDGRTDLYALGAMLFELLSGKAAWPGDSVVAIAAARILRPPPDVRTHVPDLPEAAAQVVLKLMARLREHRFATAEEAGEAIAALNTGDLPSGPSLNVSRGGTVLLGMATPTTVGRAQRKTLAVLPLLNLGAEDDEYLAQTLTEDLVDLLSVVPELRVRHSGGTARFQAKGRDVREAGRELRVDVVVDGSLRRVGELVRVSVRLVTVEDGFQLWARRFDGPPAQVLSVADDAASAIANALQTERTAEARPVASDAEAQDLYLRGRYLLRRGWFEVAREGVKMLRDAHARAPDDIRIAGTYALAVARVLTGGQDYEAVSKLARELADQTLERDPQQPEARVALGFLHLNDAEGYAAAMQLKKALTLSPNSVEALDAIGRILVEIGRTELGIATLRRALAGDPNMAQAKQSIARTYALHGDYEAANEILGPTPEHPGDFAPYYLMKGRIALWRRDLSIAQELETAMGRPGLSPFSRLTLARLHSFLRAHELTPEVRTAMEEALPIDKRYAQRRSAFHGQIRIEVKLRAGDIADAMTDLRHTDSNGLLDLVWLDRCPVFDEVRSLPEFIAVRESTEARVARVARVLDS
jgi:eukaryotic-like serine/threonine-protein kinase